MRKFISTILVLIPVLLWLILSLSSPTAAQEPSPPLKGQEPTPVPLPSEASPSPSPFPIDRALLLKIEPQLLKKLLEAEGEPAPFIVYLKAKADLNTAIAAAGPDPVAKRAIIIRALQQTARTTQGGVLQLLQTAATNGSGGQHVAAADIKSLWIINAVAAKGSLETVLALAARPDVEIVRLDKTFKVDFPLNQTSPFVQVASSEWGVSKIRADLVHSALGIDGAGVVVANVDSGVDWFHPALQTSYRGYMGPGKLPLHLGNWFDASGGGAGYPVDTTGHGTHTMGTVVGQDGVGVAPGAKWIAVKAFDSSGTAQTSWLHTAYEWILAPNGDPALAPDVVNNSWSNNNGYDTEFTADIQALISAGIFPVFAAGNNGSGAGTVGSPGSLTIAFAVGATDSNDEITDFSGRGPSPWGKIKPEISAPGKNVLSTLPGGAYGLSSGTSMATPHAAGLAALLLQASPGLQNNPTGIINAMTSTAVQYGDPIPNNDYGWGRIDAYNAVMSVASVGTLQGVISQSGGVPIHNALIQIKAHPDGPAINATSDSNGAYLQGLAANTYDVTASAFGYEPTTSFGIVIITNTATVQDFTLAAKPTGVLMGTVKDKNNPATALAATITVDGTPAATTSDPGNGGSYSLNLPVGVYTITVVAARHRITKVVGITINDGATVVQDFLLDGAPAILLVDSGRWYQESQVGYYQQALTDTLYPYDLWQITQPFATPGDIPSAETLSYYDIVIWSAPFDGPGYIGADDEIATFLDGGGRLLLSGQDIAFLDGGGYLGTLPYLKNYLKATYIQDSAPSEAITGAAAEPFAGLSFSLNNGDGANNQLSPDVIAIADPDFAGPLLLYKDASLAGIHIGLCLPYRAIFLPFGFEGINSRTARAEVMQKAITWLVQPPAATGVELTPAQEMKIGNFGTTISHRIRVRNTGASSDLVSLTLSSGAPYNWPHSSVPATLSLASCQSQEFLIEVQVPAARTWHISDTFTLMAQSNTDFNFTDIATRTTQTPAPVLLVDDDRWYSFANEFKEALTANGMAYDYWLVPKSWSGPVPPSPPLETLQMYPITVWYLAYDWFDPLTPTEEERLVGYLNQGGRLFLSGQDFLYRHLLQHDDTYAPFVQHYLGVQAHTEDYASTLVVGQRGNPVGAHLGPYLLTFPAGYNNWTDALTPTVTAQPMTLGQEGQINGLINAGAGSSGRQWHTAFLGYGPELLSSPDRARLMQRSLGWLSWLGSSTVTPDHTTSLDGTGIAYTAVIVNNGWGDLNTAHFTATFPTALIPGTASPELTLVGGNFIWSGPLAQNQSKVLTYTATIIDDLPLGVVVSQTSWLYYPEHNILFDRVADVHVNFPDLSDSSLTVTPSQQVKEKDILTYMLVLRNDGLVDDPVITATNTLPHMLELVSVDPPSQGTIVSSGKSITWTTALAKDETATLTYQAVISYETSTPIDNTAYVHDGLSPPLVLTARAAFELLPFYLPVIRKN